MKDKNYIEAITAAVAGEMEELKLKLISMHLHYKQHAEWERKRAERATAGSSIQQEILRAESYNRGRAAAIREVLDLLGGIEDE